MCPRGHTLCTDCELGTELGRAGGQSAGRRGEATMFLLAGRGCCSGGAGRTSWRVAGSMAMAKGNRVSEAEERTCADAESRARLYPWGPRTLRCDRAPHTEPEDDAEESGETRLCTVWRVRPRCSTCFSRDWGATEGSCFEKAEQDQILKLLSGDQHVNSYPDPQCFWPKMVAQRPSHWYGL